jgi:hypothetical protein
MLLYPRCRSLGGSIARSSSAAVRALNSSAPTTTTYCSFSVLQRSLSSSSSSSSSSSPPASNLQDKFIGTSLSKKVALGNIKLDPNAKITIPRFEAPPFEGYELALHRAANIVLGMAENLMSRVLHVYCGGNLVDHFGNISTLSVEGISDSKSDIDEAIAKKRYFKTDLVDFEANGLQNIDGDAHEYVVCLLPPNRDRLTIKFEELLRITNFRAFVILGLPEAVWNDKNVKNDYENLMKQERCIMYSLQKFDVESPDNNKNISGGDNNNNNSNSGDKKTVKYMLTLIRKESNKERMREFRGISS